MHRIDYVQTREPAMCYFPVDESRGDDANYFPTRLDYGVGKRSHQSHARAAVHHPDAALDAGSCESLRGSDERRSDPGGGAAEDAERLHAWMGRGSAVQRPAICYLL